MLECLKKKMNIQRKTKFHLVRLSRRKYFSRQFFILSKSKYQIYSLSLRMGRLISAPGTRFPRGGPGASSAMNAPAGSPVTSLSRRSRVPSAPINREAMQPKVLQHTFSNLAKCVKISFIFWQAAVRRACSLTFLYVNSWLLGQMYRSRPISYVNFHLGNKPVVG